jgi:OmcA/MtrC family decaheme c-type cytochrome
VRVNPYFDVTFDANGRSVPVTDPGQTRVMSDVASCNGCHDRLAVHGGGRVDVQYCVMCHNPGTTDANSGHVLTMQTMIHKIHAGRLLASQVDAGGENYVIWGFGASRHDYSHVGFPQDLRNCTVCHTAANPNTPQGDNWKTRPSKESCLTCHANNPGSDFHAYHAPSRLSWSGRARVRRTSRTRIARSATGPAHPCRRSGSTGTRTRKTPPGTRSRSRARPTIRRRARSRSVLPGRPTNNNARYNLITPDCTVSGATPTCGSNTRFGNLRFYLAYQNMVGQPTGVTEFTAYNNGGSSANAFLYRGVNDGSNTYTIDIPVPPDTPTAVAQGTARIVGTGQVKEPQLEVKTSSRSAAGRHAAAGPARAAGERGRPAHVRRRRAVRPAESAPGDRLEREVQRLPRRARHDVGLEHACQRVPRRRAQHGRGVHAVPRPEPLLVTVMTNGMALQRELLVQAHDPRHPRQLEASVSRSRMATT